MTEEERFLSDRPSAGGVVRVGQSDWVREEHILTVDMAGQSITLPDPDVVLALVRAGRGALDVLTARRRRMAYKIVAPGRQLDAAAAASYQRARSDGLPAGITSALREHAEQRALFLARYAPAATGSGPYGDVRWYQDKRYIRTSPALAGVVSILTSLAGLPESDDLAPLEASDE